MRHRVLMRNRNGEEKAGDLLELKGSSAKVRFDGEEKQAVFFLDNQGIWKSEDGIDWRCINAAVDVRLPAGERR